MKMTKCDKCGKSTRDDISLIDINAPWISGAMRGGGIWHSFDLCLGCGKSLVAYTQKFFGLEAQNNQPWKNLNHGAISAVDGVRV